MDHRASEPASAVIGHPAVDYDAPAADCDCIERVNAKLAESNTKIMLPWFGLQRPFIESMKLDEKKRGKPTKVFATFCPFCGSKYPEPSKDASIT